MKGPGIEAVEAYLAKIPEPQRSTLEKVRNAIRAAAPREAEETIRYQLPAFYYKGPLVAYGAFKEHCSLFPMSGGMADIRKIVKARVRYNDLKK